MSPSLIVFAIQSIIRIGTASKEAHAQYVRDSKILVPTIDVDVGTRRTKVNDFFRNVDNQKYIKIEPYSQYWDGEHNTLLDNASAIDALFVAMLKIQSERNPQVGNTESEETQKTRGSGEAALGYVLVTQWDGEHGPVSPLGRVALTIADIGLEYVGSNPESVGLGGNSAKLVGGLAAAMADMLDDKTISGSQEQLAENLLSIFLRAGLKTFVDNREAVTSDEHFQKLIKGSIEPVLASLSDVDGIAKQLSFREVLDSITGPAASAALSIIAENPSAFLGNDFKTTEAMGAVTQAVLSTAAKQGVNKTFSEQGFLAIYKGVLGVAVKHPELFIQKNGEPANKLASELVVNLAKVLKETGAPFEDAQDLAAKLAVGALDAVGDNIPLIAAGGSDWKKIAADMVKSVADGMSQSITETGDVKFSRVFSDDQLVKFGHIFLTHVARSPQMIVGDKAELKAIVTAVANAMAADEKLLLSGDDWLEIARVAAAEAATNPGRLFGLDGDEKEKKIATDLIKILLEVGAEAFGDENKRKTSVLFGTTLRRSIAMLIMNASGNVKIAGNEKIQEEIRKVSKGLHELILSNAAEFGNKEWLFLFDSLLSDIFAGKQVTVPAGVEQARNILMKEAA